MGKNNNQKRVRLTNDRLNAYGTRVLTAGMDIEQFERNPVLLWMHHRGEVIGIVTDIRREGDEITGVLQFDEASELSQKCKKQWDFGSLRMVSVGIDILAWDEDPKLYVEGQKLATISRSKLTEVSLVDIGANDDALVLTHKGQTLNFAKDGYQPLPLAKPTDPETQTNLQQNQLNSSTPNQSKTMDQKVLALSLGLPETATEQEITAKLATLQAAAAEIAQLREEQGKMKLGQLEAEVDKAIAEKRIEDKMRAHFVETGKTIGLEALKTTLSAISPRMKLSKTLNSSGQEVVPATFTKLSEVPADQLMELRENDPEQYRKLYKAEYGMECVL